MRAPGFVQRRNARADAPSRAKIRADWVALIIRAYEAGRRVTGGESLDRATADDLAHRVTRHGSQPFPLTHASAADAVAGFRSFAHGFIAAAQPELKIPMGRALAGAALCLRSMLEHDEAAQSEGFRRETQRRLGEREED